LRWVSHSGSEVNRRRQEQEHDGPQGAQGDTRPGTHRMTSGRSGVVLAEGWQQDGWELSADVFRQAISANNPSPYPLHHLNVSARNMRQETISLPKSETASPEAAMSRLLFEREELFRFRAEMEAAIALRRAANHK
jgi:hypothetical protein